MASVNYTVVLDLTDNGCIQTGWRLKQGDSGNSTIIAKVVNNGVDAYDPNVTPEIAFKRADGNSVLSTMTASDGYYNYTFVGNELAVPGPVVMDVTFTDEEARTSTASCRFEVVADPAGYDPEGAHTYDNPVSVLVGRATEDALIAEGFAVGQQRGQDVPESSPYYHNNAKYYSELSDPTAFANMSDVDFNNLQNGQIVKYNSTSGKWENSSSGGGGASSLDDLDDVGITTPSNGEVLLYDSANSEWINGTVSSGTNVVANPSGSATDSLTKLQVENTIYSVSGGGGSSTFAGLSDVSLTNLQNGQVPVYNSTSQKWENGSGGGGASSLNDLSDVTISSATQGQILKKGSSNWENASLSKSDVGLGNVDNTSDLSKPISTATQTALDGKASSASAGIWTSAVSGLIGDTTVTFTNANIATTSTLELFSENTSGTPIIWTSVSVSSGSATFTIKSLTEATSFKLWIRNL